MKVIVLCAILLAAELCFGISEVIGRTRLRKGFRSDAFDRALQGNSFESCAVECRRYCSTKENHLVKEKCARSFVNKNCFQQSQMSGSRKGKTSGSRKGKKSGSLKGKKEATIEECLYDSACPGHRCEDGSCANSGTCCPNEQLCPNGSCVMASNCCPNQIKCSNGSCVIPVADCDDGNKCTVDIFSCVGGTSKCERKPKTCTQENERCNPFDGLCTTIEQLIPCIAVIDEDTSFGTDKSQEETWADFRKEYPDRPFCLLQPTTKYVLSIPNNFKNNSLEFHVPNMARDNGNVPSNDWTKLCRLDAFTAVNVPWVGVFRDNSGSLPNEDTQASFNKLVCDLEVKGIQVITVINDEENWITPFKEDLVPNATSRKPEVCVNNL